MLPLMDIAVEPRSATDAEMLVHALALLAAADAEFSFHTDAETGQTLLHGIGEQHLDRIVDALRHVHGINAHVGPKQVAYRETIGREAVLTYTHTRPTGPSSQYAQVTMMFAPLPPSVGIVFAARAAPRAVPPEFIPAIERGIRAQGETGVIAGFPTVGIKCTLTDGKFHDVDSSPLAFEIAAKACFRQLCTAGAPVVLEPVMRVEIVASRGDILAVAADLLQRRARIHAIDGVKVTAFVPLAGMIGYAAALPGIARGRATFTIQYDSHQPAPLRTPPDDTFPPAVALRA